MLGNSFRFPLDMLTVDPSSSTDIYRQIESWLRDAILDGRLKSGERLPSSRNLADTLNVSRSTVITAYSMLAEEGLIVTLKGSGTRVANHFPRQVEAMRWAQAAKTASSVVLAERCKQLLGSDRYVMIHERPSAQPFRPHTPDFKAFPDKIWAQLTKQRLERRSTFWKEACPPQGYQPLRRVIADYVGASRGMSVDADQILITSGTQNSILLIAKMLINVGDTVAFEDPGYRPAANVFEMEGASILSIPVDDNGIDVDLLTRQANNIKLVYLTPSSQFPLGSSLSPARRQALLGWATKKNVLILEDDYNGEYRFSGKPLTTMYSMAEQAQVLYLGSFSKLLFPGLRLGYIVAPKSLVQPLATLRWYFDRHSPALEQAVLSDFINEGHFSRHLRRMRTLYASRQQALVAAINQYLSGIMYASPQEIGLHLIGWLEPGIDEHDFLAAAISIDIELVPVSQFCFAGLAKPGFILGYAPYSPEEIRQSIKALGRAYLQLINQRQL